MWSEPNGLHDAERDEHRSAIHALTEWDRHMANLRSAATGSVQCGEKDDDRYGGEP